MATDQGRTARSVAPPHWLAAALVVGLWLLARPYTGVRHDGTLYMGQALSHLHPEVFDNDLFFAFGSQDQFSAFARLTALLFQHLGIGTTQLCLLWICHTLLATTAYRVVALLPGAGLRWLCVAAVAVLPHTYAGLNLLNFGETFVTARLAAEPLALVGLVAAMRGRHWQAYLLLLAAAALHPLMAVPAMAVALCMRALQDKRWWWFLPIAAAAAATGAWFNVGPLGRLLQTYDSEWLGLVKLANTMVFVSEWHFQNMLVVGFDLTVLGVASRLLPDDEARLARGSVAATLLLLAVSWVGADLLHNIFVTQVQLWRVHWISHLLALLFLPVVAYDLWQRKGAWRACAWALAGAAAANYTEWSLGWAFVVWLGVTVLLAARGSKVSARMHKAVVATSTVTFLGVSAALLQRATFELMALGHEVNAPLVLFGLASTPAVSLGVAVGLFWAWSMLPRQRPWLTLVVALVLVTGVSLWDRRTPWFKEVESVAFGQHPFSTLIKPTEQVYWNRALPATWAMLGRPSYFSYAQGAGLLFNRGNALEYQRRRGSIAPLDAQRELCSIINEVRDGVTEADDCVPDFELFVDLCRFDRGPDFLVLKYDYPKGKVGKWTFSNGNAEETFYLYDCKQIR